MKNAIIRSAAALVAALPAVNALGQAIVVNNCDSGVYMWNTPSADGGGSEVDQTIAPGTTYAQTYQALTNGNGWSLKLAPTNSMASVMQFEYTYQNAGVIWYDISYVNGDPFNGNWFMSSDSSVCTPTQSYYRYSTDNANGMQQSCSSDTSITVTMCPGGAADSSSSSSSSSAPSSSAAASVAPVVDTPATTEAPKPQKVSAAPKIFTTFVTQIVTVDYTAVAKRQPEPTGEAKRDIHQHHHNHIRHQHHHQ